MTTQQISPTRPRRRLRSVRTASASVGLAVLVLSLAACTGPDSASRAAFHSVDAAPASPGVVAADHDITDADGGFIGRLRVYPDGTTGWLVPPE